MAQSAVKLLVGFAFACSACARGYLTVNEYDALVARVDEANARTRAAALARLPERGFTVVDPRTLEATATLTSESLRRCSLRLVHQRCFRNALRRA